jgi:NTP pyrophosphatase (non-canonical NTP hydrolase)
MELNNLVKEAHATSKEKGFWDDVENYNRSEKICLMHSELSEALEELRNGFKPTDIYFNGEKPEGVPVELADCLIRIADFCGKEGIDLEKAVRMKLDYNKSRPYKHNKNF